MADLEQQVKETIAALKQWLTREDRSSDYEKILSELIEEAFNENPQLASQILVDSIQEAKPEVLAVIQGLVINNKVAVLEEKLPQIEVRWDAIKKEIKERTLGQQQTQEIKMPFDRKGDVSLAPGIPLTGKLAFEEKREGHPSSEATSSDSDVKKPE